MKKLSSILLLALCLSGKPAAYGILQGKKAYQHQQEELGYVKTLYKVPDPWYSGPLLAPSANTLPPGLVNVQPYLFWTKNFGTYNSRWKDVRNTSEIVINPQFITQIGLTNYAALLFTNQLVYKRFENQSTCNYGDTPVAIAIQLVKSIFNTPIPDCKFSIGETFPSGKYQHLNPNKLGTDSSGGGSYVTSFGLDFQKVVYSWKKDLNPLSYHPTTFRLGNTFNLAGNTRVKGCNTYGGTPQTDGTVHPGNSYSVVFAWEYSITQQWVFATDWLYSINCKTTFTGNDGGVDMDSPVAQNFSVAPAIEYNLNSNFGILAGVWFSFAGKNSTDFVSGVFTFTWTF